MPSPLRCFECVECGDPVFRAKPQGTEVRCIEHATARAVANMQQIRHRRGPFYDKWAAGMARAADAAAARVVLNGIEDQAAER